MKQMLIEQIQSHQEYDLKRKKSKTSSSGGGKSMESYYSEVFLKQIQNLRSKLKNNKLFMSMVIHDMRNPTIAI
jgi:hypothetical protein